MNKDKTRNDKISIIMGIYNCGQYLEESITSILKQTYTNWELIMCDDGSIDNTYQIAEKYALKYPQKIILLKNEKNMGLNYTLNFCLEHASGDYIARQDGDDISLPKRFELEMNILNEHPEYALVSTNMTFFDENGDWGQSHHNGEIKQNDFIVGSPFCHAPCIIRKEVLKEVKGYTVSKNLLRVEDYHLWFKIYAAGYIGYQIDQCLYKMRDDHDAYKRRTWQNRINETRLKAWGFHQLKISPIYYGAIMRPILVGLLPRIVYQRLHRKKLEVKHEKN